MTRLQPIIITAIFILAAPQVQAQGASVDRRGAAEAYDKGTSAYLAEDFGQAAAWFETAYRLAPASAALQQAIKSYMRANQLARAATLALELQEEFADDEQAGQLADETLQEAAPRLVRVDVDCNGCEVTLDDKVQNKPSFFVTPGGNHRIVGSFPSGQSEKEFYAGEAGEAVELRLPPPQGRTPPPADDFQGYESPDETEEQPSGRFNLFSPEEPRSEEAGKGLPPLVTIVGAGLTAALAIAIIPAGLSAKSKGAAYDEVANTLQQDCNQMPNMCDALVSKATARYNSAHSAQTLTNVLIGSTLVTGAATAIIGIFFTDWPEDGLGAVFGMAPTGEPFGRLKVAF